MPNSSIPKFFEKSLKERLSVVGNFANLTEQELEILENYMILASQKASNLYKVEIDENGMNLDGSILSGVGRIRDVAQGPDGYLYVITSNTDGKAFPSDDDDKLLRIMK